MGLSRRRRIYKTAKDTIGQDFRVSCENMIYIYIVDRDIYSRFSLIHVASELGPENLICSGLNYFWGLVNFWWMCSPGIYASEEQAKCDRKCFDSKSRLRIENLKLCLVIPRGF